MPKKKKNQITGFTVYMKEIMPHLKATGVLPANAGIRQCVHIAHPRYKVISFSLNSFIYTLSYLDYLQIIK